ncbi:MAG: hypothetical protein EPO40_03155 [Myxococcaceae bacterium]|nr:MAG: hypothetical protein EPO40_03155 [Myxococcaceae bacterium]
MGAKRKVIIGLVSYTDSKGIERLGRLGDTVELNDDDLVRLEGLDAVGPEDSDVAASSGPVVAPTPPVSPDEAGKLLDPPAKPTRAAAKGDDSK